jgi:hypothetical protein
VRALEGWLPDNFQTAGGGLSCVGLGEDGSTYLASNLLDPAARMEQLCVHALLVQHYAPHLVAEGEIPPPPGAKGFGGRAALGDGPSESAVRRPVWLGKDYQLQRQPAGGSKAGWQRGYWRALSPLAAPVGAPLEWVEPVLVG